MNSSPINSILNGVKYVPKCGNPGKLIVFDENAYPILTGDDTSSVVFAAAEVGQGRVFVTSHEAYINSFFKNQNDFGLLWNNIKTWLLKGNNIDDDYIRNIEEFESVSDIPPSVKVLKWIGSHNRTELYIAQLIKKFLSVGGCLICGICPWGWLSVSHGKTLDEMSLNKFISSFGICFSAELCRNQLNYFDVSKNQAHNSNIGHAIDLLANDMNSTIKNENLIISGINALPCVVASKYLERLYKILYSYICLKYKPTSKMSVTSQTGRSLLTICCKLYQKYSNCGIKVKAPNIEEFPGNYSLPYPETMTGVVNIKSKFDEFHCTGYYMGPGTTIKVTVLEGNPTGWDIRISCNTDDLSTMQSLNRWPIVYSTIKLKKSINVTSAFGGLIYLDSPKGNSTIKVKLENVIEAPFFDLNQPETVKKWSKSSKSPGLWTELCGKHIVFTVPSDAVRNLIDPSKALKLWDLIVIANHELRGTDVNSTWRERVVIDIQPFNGKMHSGYPITVPYDFIKPGTGLYIFDPVAIMSGCWTLIHELGHNMQRPCWTPRGTEEVTVNIFTLHALNLVFKQQPWIHTFLRMKLDEKVLEKYAENNFSFKDWCSNPYVGLFLFAQLINSFGWNAFKILFREYESLTDKEKIFTNDLDKWDQWIIRFSNIVGLDISPLFYFWNIPFSNKPGTNLTDLTPWLPNDDITKMFPKRVEHVRRNYNGLLIGNESLYTSCPKIMYPDDFEFDSLEKLNSLKVNHIYNF